MLSPDLRQFIESVIDRQHISADDVHALRTDLLKEGLASKAEAEALLALDRTVTADSSWGPALTSFVVEFVVRHRESGHVAHDDALWLATVLDICGPTKTAMDIAYSVLDRSRNVGVGLLEFIMRGRHLERQQSVAA